MIPAEDDFNVDVNVGGDQEEKRNNGNEDESGLRYGLLSEPSPWSGEEGLAATFAVNGTSAAEDLRELLRSLPRNLHLVKKEEKAAAAKKVAAAAEAKSSGTDGLSLQPMLEILEEDEGENEDDDGYDKQQQLGANGVSANEAGTDEGLAIAWQYRKEVQQKRLGYETLSRKSSSSSDNVYCHSFDLSGRLSSQLDIGSVTHRVSVTGTTGGLRYFALISRHLDRLLAAHPRSVVRLLLYHADPCVLSVALPLLLTRIRSRGLPVVVLVAVQAWTTATRTTASVSSSSPVWCLRQVQRTCDVVLETEGFAARREYPPPAEFRSLQGLLSVRRAATSIAATAHGGGHFADQTVSKRAAANLYGLKRDRRKLHIQLLHIPPEEFSPDGRGSVSGGGVRSGGGRPPPKTEKKSSGSCGSGGGGAAALDF